MQVYLMRHPEVIDGKITKNGMCQLDYLLHSVKDTPFDHVFSSSLGRAKKIADTLKLTRKIATTITNALCEIELDSKGKLKRADIARLEKIRNHIKTVAAKKIGVTCHGNVIRWFISKELKIPFKQTMKIDIYPCSTTLLVWKKKKGKVIFVNLYNYIPKKVRTETYYGLRNLSAKIKMSR